MQINCLTCSQINNYNKYKNNNSANSLDNNLIYSCNSSNAVSFTSLSIAAESTMPIILAETAARKGVRISDRVKDLKKIFTKQKFIQQAENLDITQYKKLLNTKLKTGKAGGKAKTVAETLKEAIEELEPESRRKFLLNWFIPGKDGLMSRKDIYTNVVRCADTNADKLKKSGIEALRIIINGEKHLYKDFNLHRDNLRIFFPDLSPNEPTNKSLKEEVGERIDLINQALDAVKAGKNGNTYYNLLCDLFALNKEGQFFLQKAAEDRWANGKKWVMDNAIDAFLEQINPVMLTNHKMRTEYDPIAAKMKFLNKLFPEELKGLFNEVQNYEQYKNVLDLPYKKTSIRKSLINAINFSDKDLSCLNTGFELSNNDLKKLWSKIFDLHLGLSKKPKTILKIKKELNINELNISDNQFEELLTEGRKILLKKYKRNDVIALMKKGSGIPTVKKVQKYNKFKKAVLQKTHYKKESQKTSGQIVPHDKKTSNKPVQPKKHISTVIDDKMPIEPITNVKETTNLQISSANTPIAPGKKDDQVVSQEPITTMKKTSNSPINHPIERRIPDELEQKLVSKAYFRNLNVESKDIEKYLRTVRLLIPDLKNTSRGLVQEVTNRADDINSVLVKFPNKTREDKIKIDIIEKTLGIGQTKFSTYNEIFESINLQSPDKPISITEFRELYTSAINLYRSKKSLKKLNLEPAWQRNRVNILQKISGRKISCDCQKAEDPSCLKGLEITEHETVLDFLKKNIPLLEQPLAQVMSSVFNLDERGRFAIPQIGKDLNISQEEVIKRIGLGIEQLKSLINKTDNIKYADAILPDYHEPNDLSAVLRQYTESHVAQESEPVIIAAKPEVKSSINSGEKSISVNAEKKLVSKVNFRYLNVESQDMEKYLSTVRLLIPDLKNTARGLVKEVTNRADDINSVLVKFPNKTREDKIKIDIIEKTLGIGQPKFSTYNEIFESINLENSDKPISITEFRELYMDAVNFYRREKGLVKLDLKPAWQRNRINMLRKITGKKIPYNYSLSEDPSYMMNIMVSKNRSAGDILKSHIPLLDEESQQILRAVFNLDERGRFAVPQISCDLKISQEEAMKRINSGIRQLKSIVSKNEVIE